MPAACKPTNETKEEYELINVGIDVGKRFCQAALKAEDGRLLDELRFAKVGGYHNQSRQLVQPLDLDFRAEFRNTETRMFPSLFHLAFGPRSDR